MLWTLRIFLVNDTIQRIQHSGVDYDMMHFIKFYGALLSHPLITHLEERGEFHVFQVHPKKKSIDSPKKKHEQCDSAMASVASLG